MNNKRLQQLLLIYIVLTVLGLIINFDNLNPLLVRSLVIPWMILGLSFLIAFTRINEKVVLTICFFVYFAYILFSDSNYNWNARVFAAVCGVVGSISTYYLGKYLRKGYRP